MKIIVDADACPVKEIVIKTAKRFEIRVIMVCDTAHIMEYDYCEVITVDKSADSADFKIVSIADGGDICITGDYGLASMILAKKAYALSFYGKEYTNENIDTLLMQRYLNKKEMQAGGRIKGPKKRTAENNEDFEAGLESLIIRIK